MTDQSRPGTGVFFPAVVLGLLGVVLIPVPPPVLDGLLVGSFALGLVTLFTVLGIRRALEFSSFPTLLLMATAFRLATNIATTRSILTNAPEDGTAAAGEVIQAFGKFVAGNDPVVGFVIFLLLTVVNFVVITKGANRVSEVAARFALDALPGKQMAVDAEVAAGSVDDREAGRRRREIAEEAAFYGSMDGAMKFVRGDAMAGVLITLINIVGGLVLGMLKHGMSVGEAVGTFTVLTIGDGLVTQVPALMISISAGLLVTRSGVPVGLGAQLGRREVLRSAALLLAGLSVLAFTQNVWLGTELGLAALFLFLFAPDGKKGVRKVPPPETAVRFETLEVRVGGGFVPQLGPGGRIAAGIEEVRREIAEEWGVILPGIRVRDDLSLGPAEFCLRVRGTPVAGGRVPGTASRAEELLRILKARVAEHLHEVFGLDEMRRLFEAAACGELLEKVDRLELLHVFRRLLEEGVPIRDAASIVEAAASVPAGAPDRVEAIVEAARRALGRIICERARSEDGAIHAVELDASLEGELHTAAAQEWLRARLQSAFRNGRRVLLTSSKARPRVRRLVEQIDPAIQVLAREELVGGVPVRVLASLASGRDGT